MNEPNAYGNTPLHVACYNGQDVVVNELIDSGANVNQKNEKGFTPLHFAAASTHGALCLELLVGNGADVNMKVGIELESTLVFRSSLFKTISVTNIIPQQKVTNYWYKNIDESLKYVEWSLTQEYIYIYTISISVKSRTVEIPFYMVFQIL